jgi:rhodanese-related sulfurtransferase
MTESELNNYKKIIMGLLSMLGLGGKSESVKEFIAKGAVIIDVRTPEEFQGGHIKGSKNITLNTISSKINDIKNLNKPVIACCASGMRSSQATSILKSNGIEAMNGGGWSSLEKKL